MRNLGFIILIVSTLIGCKLRKDFSSENQNIRKEILNKKFKNEDVQSIEIVEIEHPMMGGIVRTVLLDEIQKNKFLSDFDDLKKKGIYKCMATFIIRINFKSETIRLKVCGDMISKRKSDLYYQLPSQENMINDYLEQ